MSIIEQAYKRLEELTRAGISTSANASADVSNSEPPVRRVRSSTPANTAAVPPAGAPIVEMLRHRSGHEGGRAPVETAKRVSRSVELDLTQLSEQGYLTSPLSDRRLVDEFRNITSQVLRNSQLVAEKGGRRGNIVLVTSSVPGEGKTFVSLNLALSVAMHLDHSALLVDADVLRPSMLERVGLGPQPGLIDLLTGNDLLPPDVLLRTNLAKFSMLPTGTAVDKGAELLSSAAMDNLLSDLSERYHDRIIVLDSPPLLVSTVSRSLAARVGQVLMVVAAEQTKRTAVSQGFAALESCPVVSVVLNKSQLSTHTGDYGHYDQYR